MKHGNLGWSCCLVALSAVAACAGSEDETGGNPSTGGSGGTVGNDSGADSSSGGTGGNGATGGSSGGASGGGGASGSAGAGGSAGETSDAATTSVSGNIVALTDQVTPISGMQVCVYGDSSVPCATTDPYGAYTITGVEADAEILLEFTKLNYFPALVTVKTRPTPINIGEFPAPTSGEANLFAAIANVTLDSAKGQMLATAVQAGSGGGFVGQDGVTISVTPASGSGPFFTDDQNLPDPSLTSTGPNGLGLWANVNPGDVEVTFTHPTKTCTPLAMAWPGTAANAVRMTVVAGYLVGGGAVECK